MIQGGCPEGTGMGGPGYCIKGEFLLNGVKNDLKPQARRSLAWRVPASPNSAGSQFFIMHADAPAPGRPVRRLRQGDSRAWTWWTPSPPSRPTAMTVLRCEQKIASITVDTHGEDLSRSRTSSAILTATDFYMSAIAESVLPVDTPMVFLQLPHWGRTGFDGGSEAGIAGRGAWPRLKRAIF